MTTAQTTEVPMTLGERIWYALRRGNVGVSEMASELDITRQSLGAWIADRTQRVPTLYLKTIALRCGIRYEWLRDGTGSPFAGDAPLPGLNREYPGENDVLAEAS